MIQDIFLKLNHQAPSSNTHSSVTAAAPLGKGAHCRGRSPSNGSFRDVLKGTSARPAHWARGHLKASPPSGQGARGPRFTSARKGAEGTSRPHPPPTPRRSVSQLNPGQPPAPRGRPGPQQRGCLRQRHSPFRTADGLTSQTLLCTWTSAWTRTR